MGCRAGFPKWITEEGAQALLSRQFFLLSGIGKLDTANSLLPITINLSHCEESLRTIAYYDSGPVILEDTRPFVGRMTEVVAWLADGKSISSPVAVNASEAVCRWASDYVAPPLVRFMA